MFLLDSGIAKWLTEEYGLLNANNRPVLVHRDMLWQFERANAEGKSLEAVFRHAMLMTGVKLVSTEHRFLTTGVLVRNSG
jgi:hypothetical protein